MIPLALEDGDAFALQFWIAAYFTKAIRSRSDMAALSWIVMDGRYRAAYGGGAHHFRLYA